MNVKDHPRSRGVYHVIRPLVPHFRGSSPLARGLPRYPAPGPTLSRIIPARAGFTSSCRLSTCHGTDHPRSRGVYVPPFVAPPLPPGSSPLARGLPRVDNSTINKPGIIPARAGFTLHRQLLLTVFRDHPRSRGVYRRISPHRGGVGGSSPLARGLHPSY